MEAITITYPLKYRFKTHNYIKRSVCNRYFNTKKSKEIIIKKNGGSYGIWLDRRTFIIESNIESELELIPKYKPLVGNWLNEF